MVVSVEKNVVIADRSSAVVLRGLTKGVSNSYFRFSVVRERRRHLLGGSPRNKCRSAISRQAALLVSCGIGTSYRPVGSKTCVSFAP
jgi:hypothetical protein